jgi:hypothetical protein
VRVALGKLDGVIAVDVTLKRGVAHINLKPGNALTVAQLRQTIKDAGYTSGAAVVAAVGRLSGGGRQKVLSVTGTPMSFVLAPATGTPGVAAALAAVPDGSIVQVTGTLAAPAAKGSDSDSLQVREITSVK